MISVLIPVYNGEAFIGRALDSVLAQTIRPLEILVLDDGSQDRTAEIVSAYQGVKLNQQENRGIGPSRRRLVEEAAGDWVAFLDHDDFWLAEKLAKQVIHTSRPEIGLIHTRDVFFFADGRNEPGTWMPGASAVDHVLPDCRVNMSSVLVRKEALMETGNFDSGISKAEDWLMWLRLAAQWDFAFVDEPLTWTYKHEGSASTPNSAWFEAERHVLEDLTLPKLDQLYARFSAGDRRRYRAAIQDKLGAIASLQAEALDREGRRAEARALHLRAVRQSPTRKGAWLKLGKHLARL